MKSWVFEFVSQRVFNRPLMVPSVTLGGCAEWGMRCVGGEDGGIGGAGKAEGAGRGGQSGDHPG